MEHTEGGGDLRLGTENIPNGFRERCFESLVVFLKPDAGVVAIGLFLCRGRHKELLNVFLKLLGVNVEIGSEVARFRMMVGNGDAACRSDQLVHRGGIGRDHYRVAAHGFDNIVAPAFRE